MRRILVLPLLATVLLPTAAEAVIIRLTALGEVIDQSTFILTARVERLDPGRPAMVLAVDAALKGKPSFKSLPVLLQGDAAAVRRKEPPQLLRRLAVGLPVIVFAQQSGHELRAFAYTNGTWFSLTGVRVDGEVRWSFAHLEPYLRRTYQGTTAQMTATVRDAVAGKRKPPPPNPKAKPGLGPEVPKPSSPLDGAPPVVRGLVAPILVGGPLALLAMLFPAVFGGWKRWLALLAAGGTASTLFLLQWSFGATLRGTWLNTPAALWVLMTAAYVVGLIHAWRRHHDRVQAAEAPLRAGRLEMGLLAGVSLAGVAWVVVFRRQHIPLVSDQWWPVAVLCVGLWLGTAYVGWTWLRGARLRPALASEAVVLAGVVLASVAVAPDVLGRGRRPVVVAAAGGGPRLVWTFRLPAAGAISSSPVVVGDRVFIAAAFDDVFQSRGTLYCLDRGTGAVLWSFNDGNQMKRIHSSPTVVASRLYIGEGLHDDSGCKVYCLDVRDGTKQWEFQTGSHTEATVAVVGGRLVTGAGDDGVYCLDAATGARLWQFPGFHVDASPLVLGGRVYAGAGIGDEYKTTAVLCLDAASGKPIWRHHTDLSVWCRPVVRGDRVYVASGNGRLNESADRPAGAVECLSSGGQPVWKVKFSDAVLGRMAADRERLYFGCRDGHFYCLRQSDGGEVWRRELDDPVVSGAVLEACACEAPATGRLYVATLSGLLVCLRAATGEVVWHKDTTEGAPEAALQIATPALDVRPGAPRRVYAALTFGSTLRWAELRCYEEGSSAGD